MRVSTVSLGRNCVQPYLLNYTLPPYMKVEPIIVQCITVQIMEQLMYTKAPRQHCIELGQVRVKQTYLLSQNMCSRN